MFGKWGWNGYDKGISRSVVIGGVSARNINSDEALSRIRSNYQAKKHICTRISANV